MNEDLPDWMRPENNRKDDFTNPADDFGDLNIDSLIRSEGEAGVPFKRIMPPLLITQADQNRIDIIQSILNPQEYPFQTSVDHRPVSQPALRIIIAVVMIGAVFFPQVFILVNWPFSPPELSAEAWSVYQKIQVLPPGVPVLIAVDFQPAFTDEMNAAANPVIRHLLERKALLSLVSTIPTGLIQAQGLIDQALIFSEGSELPKKNSFRYGYIPGGRAGLQYFVQDPQSVFMSSINNPIAKQQAADSTIASLAEYALVVIIADGLETGRDWVEQIGPNLKTDRMVMVLSAQAAPPIRPYATGDNDLIKGLVVGLADGIAYEQLLNRSSIPLFNWNSLNLGLIAAVIMIIIGGSLNAFLGFQRKKKKSTPGDGLV